MEKQPNLGRGPLSVQDKRGLERAAALGNPNSSTRDLAALFRTAEQTRAREAALESVLAGKAGLVVRAGNVKVRRNPLRHLLATGQGPYQASPHSGPAKGPQPGQVVSDEACSSVVRALNGGRGFSEDEAARAISWAESIRIGAAMLALSLSGDLVIDASERPPRFYASEFAPHAQQPAGLTSGEHEAA